MAETLVSGQVGMEQLRRGDELWEAALNGLQAYPQRLRRFAEAAEFQSRAWTLADLAGIKWVARPGAGKVVRLAFELDKRSGRPGPKSLWAAFDRAQKQFGEALESDSAKAIIEAFAALATTASEIADALDVAEHQPVPGPVQSKAG